MDTPVSRSKVPLPGLILLILVSVVTGIVVGAIVAAISFYPKFYLVLLFPLIMGALAGGAINVAAKAGKVRSRLFAVFFGVLTGLIMYGSYRYGEYFLEKKQAYDSQPTLSTQEVDAEIDSFLKDETGQTGFIGYVMSQAKDGIHIVPTDSTSSDTTTDMTLVGPTLYGYWIVEILIICGFGAIMASRTASIPFCERDNRFFTEQILGRVPKDSADQFMVMVRAGDWHGANMLLDTSRTKIRYPYLYVRVQKCPACNTNPVPLNVVRKLGSRKRNERIVFKTTLSANQYSDLLGTPVQPTPVSAY